MRTRIISAFPGTGKSYYHKLHPDTTLDSDSSLFSWIVGVDGVKVRNPDFPENYIKHIRENIGKYDFIFVSSHKEVREALINNCIFFYLMYPQNNFKEMFLKRYKDRGSDDAFINLIDTNWYNWLHELSFCRVGCAPIRGVANVAEEIQHIIASEHGDVKVG